jgi:hypothetical protein
MQANSQKIEVQIGSAVSAGMISQGHYSLHFLFTLRFGF